MKSRKITTKDVLGGKGGEIHQGAGGVTPVLTVQQEMPISDGQNSLKVSPLGSMTRTFQPGKV